MVKQTFPSVISDNDIAILVGNGACDLMQLSKSPKGKVIAVDGGLRHVLKAGLTPNAVIGDMDSIDLSDLQVAGRNVVVYKSDDQDTTDFEKALLTFSAPVCLAYGFLGLRVDHILAAMTVLARYADTHKIILVGADDLVHVTTQPFAMALAVGARLSVWPVGSVRFSGSSGLVWPLDGLMFSPDGQVATSNRMKADRLTLTPASGNKGAYAVCCDPEFLPQMMAALTPASGIKGA